MKPISLIPICCFLVLLSCTPVLGQKKQDGPGKNNCADFNYSHSAGRMQVEGGVFVPIGHLTRTLNPSPQLAFYLCRPLSAKYSIDMGTSIFIPVNSRQLQYILPDTVLTGKAILSGVMGLWCTRTETCGKKYFWDSRIGSGLGFFQTDIDTNKPESENDSVYGSETIFLNVGSGMRMVAFSRRCVGLGLNYYYVPYNAFHKNFQKGFGNQYLTASVSFTF